MNQVIRYPSRLNDYVINIVFHEVMHHVVKDYNHCTLVSGTCILKSERHDSVVEVPHWHLKSSAFSISNSHLNLIVATKAIHE